MKVCVAGLGRVGLPTALYVASQGLEVFGYDISEKAVARAKSRGISASNTSVFENIQERHRGRVRTIQTLL